MMEAIGDITATCDVSRLDVEGRLYETRIQGGVLADGFNGLLACLSTITPMSTFAQNNGVIALTRCANRKAGYFCCFWLIVAGIFSKFAAALVAIPVSTYVLPANGVSNKILITLGYVLGSRARGDDNIFVFSCRGLRNEDHINHAIHPKESVHHHMRVGTRVRGGDGSRLVRSR